MSQQSAVIKTSTASLDELRLENEQLQRHIAAQKAVIDSVERRAGRSLKSVEDHLNNLLGEAQEGAGWYTNLSAIHYEIGGLCDLISDAMLLQKLEAGKVEVRLEALDLKQLLEATNRHLLEPRCSAAVRLICKIDPRLSPVLADQELTEAVLMDLIARSLKYSDLQASVLLEVEQVGAHVHLHLSAQRFAPSGDRDFATEIALCCRRIEVQNGQIVCHHHSGGLQTVSITFPIATEC